jgi:hypothetical protein
MDTHTLPDAIEPTYWNVVFHPSVTWFHRMVLGRFQHVSAFTYIPGTGAWIMVDCQWGGMRIAFIPRINVLVAYTSDCSVIKFDRVYAPFALASRFGFYCVPAIKQLLGLSCVAATPDGLYRHLIRHGGELISGQRVDTAAAAAGSDAAGRTAAGASQSGCLIG